MFDQEALAPTQDDPQDDLLQGTPTPEEEGDPEGGDPQPKLYAGKYKTIEEMERAYVEQQKVMGRQGQELGEYRKRYGQHQDTPAQPAPKEDPREAEIKRLTPLVQSYRQMGYDEQDAWTMAVVADQHAQNVTKAALQSELAPLKSMVQQGIGHNLYSKDVESVFTMDGIAGIESNAIAEQIANAVPPEEWINATPDQRQQFIRLMAYSEIGRNQVQGNKGKRAPKQDAPNVGGSPARNAASGKGSAQFEQTVSYYMNTFGFSREEAESTAKGE